MRLAHVVLPAVAVLILGGCNSHRQSHLQFPTVQDRAWWCVEGEERPASLAVADELAYASMTSQASTSRSIFAVSDSLGAASFHDTASYVQAVRQERADRFAAVEIK